MPLIKLNEEWKKSDNMEKYGITEVKFKWLVKKGGNTQNTIQNGGIILQTTYFVIFIMYILRNNH